MRTARGSTSFWLALVAVGTLAPGLGAQIPAGPEFRVNTYTTNSQSNAGVAMDSYGDFVVVWSSYGQDGSNWGVFGQRYDASGAPRGGEFRVHSYTTGRQGPSTVASRANGDFVVAWGSDGEDGSFYGVFARRFDAAGSPVGAEFQVNTYTTGDQWLPRMAMDASGRFIVTWQSGYQDGSNWGVYARRFDTSGAALGGEFPVNTFTTGIQRNPAVAADAGGGFVVVWETYASAFSAAFGRRFNASGVPQGAEFLIDSDATFVQMEPAVASDAAGNFVVVWTGGPDPDSVEVLGQRFDASGAAQGDRFTVNTGTIGRQRRAALAMDGEGGFVVTWDGPDGAGGDGFARRFDASGVPQGPEFQVNSYTTSLQAEFAVAAEPGGNFVVAWTSFGQDGSDFGVFGRQYGDLIFKDGFQSGGLERWTVTSTDGGDLAADGQAALAGTTIGLRATVDDVNPLYVEDDRPFGEKRYRARFYLDTNGIDPGEASGHYRIRLLIAFNRFLQRAFAVVLKRRDGAYAVMGRVLRDDGSRADTAFLPLGPGPHFIEVDWRRADGPGVGNGAFEMWIDGISAATLSGLDNDLSTIETARLGAISVKPGASGTLFFDQFESRRQVYIGPE